METYWQQLYSQGRQLSSRQEQSGMYVIDQAEHRSLTIPENIQTREDCNAVRRVAWTPMAHGLGRLEQRAQVGEPIDGLAVISGLHAGDTRQLQVEGRCHSIC